MLMQLFLPPSVHLFLLILSEETAASVPPDSAQTLNGRTNALFSNWHRTEILSRGVWGLFTVLSSYHTCLSPSPPPATHSLSV